MFIDSNDMGSNRMVFIDFTNYLGLLRDKNLALDGQRVGTAQADHPLRFAFLEVR